MFPFIIGNRRSKDDEDADDGNDAIDDAANDDGSSEDANANNAPPMFWNLKARLARSFLDFLDEHGNYRSSLEEAAARAAAAEANSLWARDNENGRERRRRSTDGGGWDDEYHEDGRIIAPPAAPVETTTATPKLPEDPYEQIMYYYSALKLRLASDAKHRAYRARAYVVNVVHDELHHHTHVPVVCAVMLLVGIALHFVKLRRRAMRPDVRAHSVLGKKFFVEHYVQDDNDGGGGGDDTKKKEETGDDDDENATTVTTTIMTTKVQQSSSSMKHRIRIIIQKYINIILLRYTNDKYRTLLSMRDKSTKAEMAALSSMKHRDRTRYQRLIRLERTWEIYVMSVLCIMAVSSCVICLSSSLYYSLLLPLGREGSSSSSTTIDGGIRNFNDIYAIQTTDAIRNLNGHLYNSLHGHDHVDTTSTVYDEYDACLESNVEEVSNVHGLVDFSMMCDFNNSSSFVLSNNTTLVVTPPPPPDDVDNDDYYDVVTSPFRTTINDFLITKLHIPPTLSTYLTTLRLRTLSYLSSIFVFLLLLASHYIANKITLLTMYYDPMKHFVLRAADTSVKADGTVEAKRGETEAQRKKRERMMQAERLKAQMAQLAMEAKMAAQARIARLEGAAAAAAAVESENTDKPNAATGEDEKLDVESEEMLQTYSRQFGMIKAGVPEGAILNSLITLGIDDEDERIEIVNKLREIKVAKAQAAQRAEEALSKKVEDEQKKVAKQLEDDKKREIQMEEKTELLAKERLQAMKSKKGSFDRTDSNNSGAAELKKRLEARKVASSSETVLPPSSAAVESSSVVSKTSSKSTITSTTTDPSVARANMLGQIGTACLKKKTTATTTTPKVQPLGTMAEKLINVASTTSLEAVGLKSPINNETPRKSNMSGSSYNATFLPPAVPPSVEISEEGGEKKKTTNTISLPPAMPSLNPIHHPPPNTRRSDYSSSYDGTSEEGSEDSPPPILVRVSSSPDDLTVHSITSKIAGVILPPMFQSLDFNSPSMWDQKRPSSKDIQAAITAVETAPEEEEVREVVDLSRSWKHTPAFEMAMRTSNASWDRRATSMDIMAKIRAVEMLEAKEEEEEEEEEVHQAVATNNEETSTPRIGTRASSGVRRRQLHQEVKSAQDVLEIIDERQGGGDIITSPTSFDIKRKASKGGGGSEDDEISELSEPTFNEHNPFNKGRGIPLALNVLQSTDDFVDMSPIVSSVGLSPSGVIRKKLLVADNLTTLPAFPPDTNVDSGKTDAVCISMTEEMAHDTVIEETEEQKQRREKAEARVKKMDAITARRSAGIIDEDESSFSGISKRHRLRRKKRMQLPQCQEEVSIKSDDRSVHPSDDRSTVTPVKIDTEEEKQRKLRADARAKKLEEMSSMRNSGYVNDDESAITGISKRHRIRRKKSALAAITPEERERAEWKNGVYTSVMNAEQVQWQTSIYTHVLHAETTRTKNIAAKLELEEKTLAEHRRLENKKRLDKMARKFASRAEQFHKIRQEGREDDDISVVSGTSRLKRRRNRKSIVPQNQEAPLAEETHGSSTTAQQLENLEVRLQQIKESSNDAPCVVDEPCVVDAEVPSEPIALTLEDRMDESDKQVQEAMEQEIDDTDVTVKKKRNRKKKKKITKTNE